jgi:hypothetical protein
VFLLSLDGTRVDIDFMGSKAVQAGEGMRVSRRRKYRSQSKSTHFAVYIYYAGGLDSIFDEALRRFARLHGMGFGGSGCWLRGKNAGGRDISFCCGNWMQARNFIQEVRVRFKVRAKLVDNAANA